MSCNELCRTNYVELLGWFKTERKKKKIFKTKFKSQLQPAVSGGMPHAETLFPHVCQLNTTLALITDAVGLFQDLNCTVQFYFP